VKKGRGQWSLDKELHLLSEQFKHKTMAIPLSTDFRHEQEL